MSPAKKLVCNLTTPATRTRSATTKKDPVQTVVQKTFPIFKVFHTSTVPVPCTPCGAFYMPVIVGRTTIYLCVRACLYSIVRVKRSSSVWPVEEDVVYI